MIAGKKYDPGTWTSRRPTPEKFEHLRKWIAPVERSIDLTSITEITNINQQLEQSAKLFISNIISRVIAQLVAAYGDGFVSLQATAAGALNVHQVNLPAAPAGLTTKEIDIVTSGYNSVVSGTPGKKIKITTLMFTVSEHTEIELFSSVFSKSGAMSFGGTGEPRGMVSNHGLFPFECNEDEAFQIWSSANVNIDGYVIYYKE